MKNGEVNAKLYATLESLNEEGIRRFAHGLIDALAGSPDEQMLRIFLSEQRKNIKVLALRTFENNMRLRNGVLVP